MSTPEQTPETLKRTKRANWVHRLVRLFRSSDSERMDWLATHYFGGSLTERKCEVALELGKHLARTGDFRAAVDAARFLPNGQDQARASDHRQP